MRTNYFLHCHNRSPAQDNVLHYRYSKGSNHYRRHSGFSVASSSAPKPCRSNHPVPCIVRRGHPPHLDHNRGRHSCRLHFVDMMHTRRCLPVFLYPAKNSSAQYSVAAGQKPVRIPIQFQARFCQVYGAATLCVSVPEAVCLQEQQLLFSLLIFILKLAV